MIYKDVRLGGQVGRLASAGGMVGVPHHCDWASWVILPWCDSPFPYRARKPVELAVRAQYSSLAGENVLDIFGGSGSTLIAPEQTGHQAFLMEIAPLYCDVIVQRWEKFTGRKAELTSEA